MRALTRDPSRRSAKALADARRRGRADGHRRSGQRPACVRRRLRRILRHLLLGPLLGRARRRGGRVDGRRGQGGRRPARDLVDARGHARLHAARRRPDADAAGQVQGAALRRQGRARTTSSPTRACRRRSCNTCVLLGELHLLRHRARSAARTAVLALTIPMDDKRSCPGSPPRTSARSPTGSSRRPDAASDRRSASPASNLTGAEMAAGLTTRARRGGAVQRCLGRRLPQLRLSRRGRRRQHVPVQGPTSRPSTAGRATSMRRAPSTRSCRTSTPGSRGTRTRSRSSNAPRGRARSRRRGLRAAAPSAGPVRPIP